MLVTKNTSYDLIVQTIHKFLTIICHKTPLVFNVLGLHLTQIYFVLRVTANSINIMQEQPANIFSHT